MTAYPSSIKSFTAKTDGVDDVLASHVNDLQNEVAAIETELGTLPKGSSGDVKTRLGAVDTILGASPQNTSADVAERIKGIRSLAGASDDVLVISGGNAGLSSSADFYTIAWTDYSATSTIVGWSSFTYKKIMYKRIGKLIFVSFYLDGTSDSTSATFTLPYNADTTALNTVEFAIRATDNGAAGLHMGFGDLSTPANKVWCYPDNSGGTAWTASGRKYVVGQFFYQAA